MKTKREATRSGGGRMEKLVGGKERIPYKNCPVSDSCIRNPTRSDQDVENIFLNNKLLLFFLIVIYI